MISTNERQLLRKPDAAKLLAMSESMLEKLTCRRAIPHLRIGRSVYYDTADLWTWLDAKKVKPLPAPPAPPRATGSGC